jgi:hypothetical protein
MSHYKIASTASVYIGGVTGATGAIGSYGTMGTSVGSNGTFWSTTANTINYTVNSVPAAAMNVKGDLEVEGALTVNGRNLSKLMEKIEDRLAILSDPKPDKLEKFAALKKAYDHYKLMEKLIGTD